MPPQLDPDALAPLLRVAAQDTDTAVRVGALDAAARFPLTLEAWQAVASACWRIVDATPAGSRPRRAALALAARIPLRSLRLHLRERVVDPAEVDADAIAVALDAAADASRITALLARAAGGGEAFPAALAAMPVEAAAIVVDTRAQPRDDPFASASPDERALVAADIPPLPSHARAIDRFWHALVLARLGEFGPLDAILLGEAAEPELFNGSPWFAYQEIARIRPVPAAMRAHLLALLARTDAPGSARLDHPTRRMLHLTVWAATGIADAEGTPIAARAADEARATPAASATPAAPAPAPAPAAAAAAAAAPGSTESAPSNTIADLLRAIEAGNRRAGALPDDGTATFTLSTAIIDLALRCPPDGDWPVAALVAAQLRTPRPVLDDGQFAWLLARDRPAHLIEQAAALLGIEPVVEARLRIVGWLAGAADHQGDRGGSPYRGDGPGAGAADAVRRELLDDTNLRAAMAAPAVAADFTPEPDRFDAAFSVGEPTSGAQGETGDAGPQEAGAAPGESGAAPEEAAAAGTPPQSDPRTVNASLMHDGRRRSTFVAGADNVVRCWIGLPEAEHAAVADRTIPSIPIPAEGLPLTVQLCWRDSAGQDHTDARQLLLPAEHSARSGDCDLRVHVPGSERYVAADIVFRYRGRAFEVVRLEAFALAADEAESPMHAPRLRVQASRREVIALPDSRPVDATIVYGDVSPSADAAAARPPALRVFGGDGAGSFDLSGAGDAVKWLNEALFATEKLIVRKRAAANTGATAAAAPLGAQEVLDADDPDLRVLLRDMARHGAGLYNQLRDQGFTDPGERLQLLNLEPDNYVPLEFVYDRGYPVSAATLCAEGVQALLAGDSGCPACRLPAADDQRANAPIVCPFGFWSLRKIIERVGSGEAAQLSAPTARRRQLPVIDAVAFASSHLVPQDERDATRRALEHSVGRLYPAEDWLQWRDALRHQPPLLVVIPHHGIQAALDYLEIGDEQLPEDLGKLSHAQIDRQYVNPEGRDPGPIVLLLGCQTAAVTETGYVGISRRIQQQRAAIVLGTLAQILGRHAAPLARELVTQLASIDDGESDFGAIMRRVRRNMLARGYLMALCLVALGDAEWRLTPRSRADPH